MSKASKSQSRLWLYNEDCFQTFKRIKDSSVDVVLTDLPYGTTQNRWDVIIPFDSMWLELNRICKPNTPILFFSSQPFTSLLITSNLKMFRYDLIWEKNKSTGFLNAKRMPLRSHESILVFYKNPPIYNPQKTTGHKPVNAYTKHNYGTNYGKAKIMQGGGETTRCPTSILKFPVVNNDSVLKFHPTQKPVSLLKYLLKTYSKRDDLILDFTMGSGSTGVACGLLDRRFIGCDSDKVNGYFQKAQARITKVFHKCKETDE